MAPSIFITHDDQIGAPLDRFVDDRGAGVARLEHLRMDLDVPLAGDFLGVGQDGFTLLNGFGEFGVKGEGLRHFDDMDDLHLHPLLGASISGGRGEQEGKLEDFIVEGGAFQRH